jgi:hypothetical protein
MNKNKNFHVSEGLLEYLQNSQLVNVFLQSQELWVRLDFSTGSNEANVSVEFLNVLHFTISKTIDDEEGSYLVGNVKLERIEDGGLEVLSNLKYPFKDRTGQRLSFPSRDLFHFYLEGDVCIHVVCTTYKVLKEIKIPDVLNIK